MKQLKDIKFSTNCSKCKRKIHYTLEQAANESLLTCTCGHEVQLKDSKGNMKKKLAEAQKSLDNLDKTIKNLFK